MQLITHPIAARAIVAAPVIALLLSACGGGGGGGSTTASTSATGTSAATPKVNDQSAMSQLGSAYSVASSLYSMGSNSSSMVTKDAGTNAGAPFSTLDFAMARLDALVKPQAAAEAEGVATKAVSSATLACSSGGSMSAVINDANNDGIFGTGDTASFTFNACRESGLTMSGRMQISQVLVNGSVYSPSYSVGATFSFDAMSAASTWAPTVTIQGGFAMQAAYTNSPALAYSATLSGTSFSATQGGVTDSLSNFAASLVVNASTGRYQYSVSGREANSAQNVAFTITSPTPFQGTVGSYPSSGSLRVQASDGSAARLTATSATSVVVEVDANGDGAYETSSTKTWSQIVSG